MAGYGIFSKMQEFFKSSGNKEQDINIRDANNSILKSEDELILKQLQMGGNYSGGNSFAADEQQLMFDSRYSDRAAKVALYREMSVFPEITEIIEMVCNEAIYRDEAGNYFDIDFNNDFSPDEKEVLREEFRYVIDVILNFEENGHDLFKKFLIDGALALDIIYDNESIEKATKVSTIKTLPPWSITPVYKNGIITGYIQNPELDQSNSGIAIKYDKVAFATYTNIINNSGLIGYLEPAIRPYNMLKQVQDALAIYRLVRAPEKRIWNIEAGDINPGKAENFLQQMIQKYRSDIKWDSSAGKIVSGYSVVSMLKDFWFLKKDGQGTQVDVLSSTMSLGDLEDIKMYTLNLQRALLVPKSRRDTGDGNNQYSSGKDIEREEQQFTNWVERLQTKFTKIVYTIFRCHLKSVGYSETYYNEGNFIIRQKIANYFRTYRDQEIMDTKLSLINTYSNFIWIPESNEEGMFSQEFFMRYVVKFPDELLALNSQLLFKEKAKAKAKVIEAKAKKTSETDTSSSDAMIDDSGMFGGGDDPGMANGSDLDVDSGIGNDAASPMEDIDAKNPDFDRASMMAQ